MPGPAHTFVSHSWQLNVGMLRWSDGDGLGWVVGWSWWVGSYLLYHIPINRIHGIDIFTCI